MMSGKIPIFGFFKRIPVKKVELSCLGIGEAVFEPYNLLVVEFTDIWRAGGGAGRR